MDFQLPTRRASPLAPPEALLNRAASNGPISRLRYPDGHLGWLCTGYEAAKEILRDPRFSADSRLKRSPVERPGAEPFIGSTALPGWFIDLDRPDHTRLRRLVSTRLGMRGIHKVEQAICETVASTLDEILRIGPPVDLVQVYALEIPSLVICDILGVPREWRRIFQGETDELFSLESNAVGAERSMRQLESGIAELLREKDAAPRDDLLSDLAREPTLGLDEAVGIGVLLLTAGHETIASMLGLSICYLLGQPDVVASLRDQPDHWDMAIEELLRYLTIFQYGVPRSPLEDLVLFGNRIRAGECVTVSLPAANQDPTEFERPDEIDLSRNNRDHLAFGFGIHQCIGKHLARIELKVALSELLKRIPGLELIQGEAIQPNLVSSFHSVRRLRVTW